MTPDTPEGYLEIEHTADISLRIWATTLKDLFKLAVEGLNSIIDIDVYDTDTGNFQKFCIEDIDLESMLISLLNECNFKIQEENLCTQITELFIEKEKISGSLCLKKIKSFRKEIKAVTYHNLRINHSKKGYSVVIVFDV